MSEAVKISPRVDNEGHGQLSGWTMHYEGWKPDQEPTREALCVLGNGYMAVRGAHESAGAGGPHYPGTYLAGGYNRAKSTVHGKTIENEDFVNFPNWLELTFKIGNGEWFEPEAVTIESYTQRVELYHGVLHRCMVFRDSEGNRTKLCMTRFVHMQDSHCAGMRWELKPLNWTGECTIRSGIDGSVTNSGVARYGDLTSKHLNVVDTREMTDGVYLMACTRQSAISVAEAAITRFYDRHGHRIDTAKTLRREPERIAHEYRLKVDMGEPVTIEKTVSVVSSRDHAISEPGIEAREAVKGYPRFAELLESHCRTWENIWRRCDIELSDNTDTQKILRLHIFHLMQTASMNIIDRDVSIPSRGIHGEAYRGHIMWDELFILPFLTLHFPVLTREVLMYRYRRLGKARRAAKKSGYRGAMYPWQSGSDGREESQDIHLNPMSGRWVPDNTHLQRHVNAAIVYSVWQYYLASDDREFLHFFGAEMVLEVARFWCSLATYNPDRDKYEIHNVVGPDEYHTGYPDSDQPGLNNNAYTNVMASWVLQRAGEVLNVLHQERREELMRDLSIEEDEIDQWHEIAHKLYVPFLDNRVISQFEGYGELEELDWGEYRRKHGEMMRLDRILEAESDDVLRYKAGKQADVLMLFYLFSGRELSEQFRSMGYEFSIDDIPRNISYYQHRTSHGSTLSSLVFSWVLSRADRPKSWETFRKALLSDVEDVQGGTTSEGIHLGAMAGTVDMMQRCYIGLEIRKDVLWFNPALPETLEGLELRIRFRGQWLQLSVDHSELSLRLMENSGGCIKVGVRDKTFDMVPGEEQSISLIV